MARWIVLTVAFAVVGFVPMGCRGGGTGSDSPVEEGETPDPWWDDVTPAPVSVDPEPPVPEDRSGFADAASASVPVVEDAQARWSGQGEAWTRRLGGSPRDYPGPAAVVADAAEPAADLTWAGPAAVTSGQVCVDTPSDPDWMGAVSALSLGATDGCADLESCRSELLTRFDAGVSLVLFDPGAPSEGRLELVTQLAEAARQHSEQRGRRHQLGLVVGAGEEAGLLDMVRASDVVVLGGSGVELSRSGRLTPLNMLIRGAGRRALMRYPFADASLRGTDRELVAVAEHLSAGGGLLLEPGQRLPETLATAADLLRANPELSWRASGALAVVVDAARPTEPAVEMLRRFEVRRIPTEVLVAPSSGRWDSGVETQRLTSFPVIAFPQASQSGGDALRLLTQEVTGNALIFPAEDQPPEMRAQRLSDGGRTVRGIDAEGRGLGEGLWGLPIDVDLPEDVHVIRAVAPHDGLVVHHLINRGLDARGRSTQVPTSSLALRGAPVGHFADCHATWYLPAEGRTESLTCRASPGGDIEVELPSFDTWAVVAAGAVPRVDPDRYGKDKVTIVGPGGVWSGASVKISVPFWSTYEELSLSLPEQMLADDGPDFSRGMVHRFEAGPDGLSATLTSTSDTIRLSRTLRSDLDSVDVAFTVTNLGETPIRGLRALVCLASKGASLFPPSGQDATWVVEADGLRTLGSVSGDGADPVYPERSGARLPLTILGSVDDQYSLGIGFEEGDIVGGNGGGGGTCIHSRPIFGDLAPGESVTRRGMIFTTADKPGDVVTRWEEKFGKASSHGAPQPPATACEGR